MTMMMAMGGGTSCSKAAHTPPRDLHVESWGDVTVSTESLQDALIDDDGELLSVEASRVDDSIFFYVEDAAISLPTPKLAELLKAVG